MPDLDRRALAALLRRCEAALEERSPVLLEPAYRADAQHKTGGRSGLTIRDLVRDCQCVAFRLEQEARNCASDTDCGYAGPDECDSDHCPARARLAEESRHG